MPKLKTIKEIPFLPASLALLSQLEKLVIKKALVNQCCNIVAFRGSGNTSNLKYICQNSSVFPSINKNHIFSFLDLSLMAEREEHVFKETIAVMLKHFDRKDDPQVYEKLEGILNTSQMLFGSFLDLLNYLTYQKGMSLTFVVDKAYLLYQTNRYSKRLIENLLSVLRQNPMKTSFIFISDVEFSKEDYPNLGFLLESFIQNIIWGKDILFEEKSSLALFVNQEKWHDHIFSKKFITKALEVSSFDPSILKYIATKALSEDTFESEFISSGTTEKIYKLIGTDYLDQRYRKITLGLSRDSLSCLRNNYTQPTEFLLKTGLIREDKGNFLPLNILFDHFVKENKSLLTEIPGASLESPNAQIKKDLSGQELIVYELLVSKVNTVVSKDELAKAIWGETWEENYSDWAIDKLISNLRKKLEQTKSAYLLKTFKGKGLMFSTL